MNILQLDRQADTGMVQTIHWERTAGAARVYGSVELPPADPEAMIPYEELDAETVLLWLEDALGEAELLRIDQKLAEQLTPSPIASGLPWE
jgi:hypothetical protein